MSIELCVLASGSGGNSTVVRTPGGVMLIDAGIGPRTAARRLDGTGVAVGDVAAICLTHLDRDHFSATWLRTICARGIRVFCHRARVRDVLRLVEGDEAAEAALAACVVPFTEHETFEPIEGLTVRAVPLAHDAQGSHGFLLEGFGSRVGYATDLGRVPTALLDQFCDLDLLAIESNYDPHLQVTSGRPWFLQQRIMGGRGHLSNAQAFDAVRQILNGCEQRGARLPAHIVLLHRSRQCNCPRVVRDLFERDVRIAQRLTLAEQFERTEWLRREDVQPAVGEQLALAWG
jgi:phosphoribosyl 1,2-cyclic phosphodiesterase